MVSDMRLKTKTYNAARLLLFAALMAAACAPVSAGGLSLGLGYPYVSVKCGLSGRISAEGRYYSADGIDIYAGRLYWDFAGYAFSPGFDDDKIKLFAGLEGGHIKFDSSGVKGSGSEAAVFAGGEYRITRSFSILMDFAPTLISLKDGDNDDVKVDGVEFVANLGLYFRFGGK